MDGRSKQLVLLLSVLAFPFATSLAIGQSLNGQTVTVTMQETCDGCTDVTDNVVAGLGGPQIVGGSTSTNIGNEILFSGESVDLQNLQIDYHIYGNGAAYAGPVTGMAAACNAAPGCLMWGETADDARFLFSGLSFGVPGEILQGVSLSGTTNVFNVQIADVTPTSFEVIFGAAGVLKADSNTPGFGDIVMDLTVEPAPVPEPSTYVLMLGGLAGLLIITRRRYWGAAELS